MTSAKTGLPRKGKRRPKIDIRIVCKQQVPNRGYCIEAKRLYRSDSVSEYLDNEGIGAFILGEYAKDDDHGGMVGYVQTGKMQDWLSKVENRLPRFSHHRMADKREAWGGRELHQRPSSLFQEFTHSEQRAWHHSLPRFFRVWRGSMMPKAFTSPTREVRLHLHKRCRTQSQPDHEGLDEVFGLGDAELGAGFEAEAGAVAAEELEVDGQLAGVGGEDFVDAVEVYLAVAGGSPGAGAGASAGRGA